MWGSFFGGPRFSMEDDDGRLDRTYWREKSDAVLRHADHAKALFDGFLQDAESMTTFTVTKDELVPASVDLTDVC